MPGHLFEGNPVVEGTTRRGTDTPMHRPEKPAGSTLSSTSGLSLRERDLRVMLSKKERWKELTVKLIKCHALKIAARLEEEWGLWFKQSAPNFQIRL